MTNDQQLKTEDRKKIIENLSEDLRYLMNERKKIEEQIENVSDIFVEVAGKEGQ